MLSDADLQKALDICEEAALTEGELRGYDK
jgi:hypothetical protein